MIGSPDGKNLDGSQSFDSLYNILENKKVQNPFKSTLNNNNINSTTTNTDRNTTPHTHRYSYSNNSKNDKKFGSIFDMKNDLWSSSYKTPSLAVDFAWDSNYGNESSTIGHSLPLRIPAATPPSSPSLWNSSDNSKSFSNLVHVHDHNEHASSLSSAMNGKTLLIKQRSHNHVRRLTQEKMNRRKSADFDKNIHRYVLLNNMINNLNTKSYHEFDHEDVFQETIKETNKDTATTMKGTSHVDRYHRTTLNNFYALGDHNHNNSNSNNNRPSLFPSYSSIGKLDYDRGMEDHESFNFDADNMFVSQLNLNPFPCTSSSPSISKSDGFNMNIDMDIDSNYNCHNNNNNSINCNKVSSNNGNLKHNLPTESSCLGLDDLLDIFDDDESDEYNENDNTRADYATNKANVYTHNLSTTLLDDPFFVKDIPTTVEFQSSSPILSSASSYSSLRVPLASSPRINRMASV